MMILIKVTHVKIDKDKEPFCLEIILGHNKDKVISLYCLKIIQELFNTIAGQKVKASKKSL